MENGPDRRLAELNKILNNPNPLRTRRLSSVIEIHGQEVQDEEEQQQGQQQEPQQEQQEQQDQQQELQQEQHQQRESVCSKVFSCCFRRRR